MYLFYLGSSSWGATDRGFRGAHLNPLDHFFNPLGLFLRTSVPFVWRVLSAFPPACTPWLRGTVLPPGDTNGIGDLNATYHYLMAVPNAALRELLAISPHGPLTHDRRPRRPPLPTPVPPTDPSTPCPPSDDALTNGGATGLVGMWSG